MSAKKTATQTEAAPKPKAEGITPAELQEKLGDKHITGPKGSGGYAEPGIARPKEPGRGKR